MKAIYRYWCNKKQCWRHKQIPADRMEDVEEFMTHTELDIDRVIVDGKPMKFN